MTNNNRLKKKTSVILGTAGAFALLVIYLSPLYLMFSIAMKSKEEFSRNPFGLTFNIQWHNFVDAAKKMGFLSSGLSSLIIAVTSIFLILLFASLASYALGRRKTPLYSRLYLFFLAGLMIPFQLTMLPLYKLIKSLDLMGTYLGVILLYSASGLPVAVVVLTGFIRTLPRELDEAAMIDGASLFRVFWEIILPLIKAPLVTVLIFSLVGIWNDLLTPMLFLGSRNQTLVVNLYKFRGAFNVTDWTMIFAGSIMTMLPLLVTFLFCQKYFIKGMIAGAIKG